MEISVNKLVKKLKLIVSNTILCFQPYNYNNIITNVERKKNIRLAVIFHESRIYMGMFIHDLKLKTVINQLFLTMQPRKIT
jgi:ribonuclease HIII